MALTITTDFESNLRTILNWVETYSGLGAGKVIWLNQEVPRPAKPYAGILIFAQNVRFGFDHVEDTFAGNRVQQQTSGPRQLTAQIEVYTDPPATLAGLDAAQRLENALLALDSQAVRDAFRAAKLGMLSHGSINRLDEQFGDRWERRAQADVLFTYSGETFDDGVGPEGDWVQTVEVPTESNGNATYNE